MKDFISLCSPRSPYTVVDHYSPFILQAVSKFFPNSFRCKQGSYVEEQIMQQGSFPALLSFFVSLCFGCECPATRPHHPHIFHSSFISLIFRKKLSSEESSKEYLIYSADISESALPFPAHLNIETTAAPSRKGNHPLQDICSAGDVDLLLFFYIYIISKKIDVT